MRMLFVVNTQTENVINVKQIGVGNSYQMFMIFSYVHWFEKYLKKGSALHRFFRIADETERT